MGCYCGCGLEISRSYYDDGVTIAVSAVLSRWIGAVGIFAGVATIVLGVNVALFVGQILKIELNNTVNPTQ